MYKLMHLPTGTFVQCPVRNADIYTLHYDFVDWVCFKLEDAEEYLLNDFEVWGDLVCTTKGRRLIGMHWIKKYYGDKGSLPLDTHFQIIEVEEDG